MIPGRAGAAVCFRDGNAPRRRISVSTTHTHPGLSRRRVLGLGAGALAAGAAGSLTPARQAQAAPLPAAFLDLDTVIAKMRSELDGRAVGWAVAAVGPHGAVVTDHQGQRRTAADAPAAPASATVRFNVAQATRTVTAIAALQALAARGLGITDRIAPLLPIDWVKGPQVNSLTFRDLLTHRSGFRTNAETFGELKAAISAGVHPADKQFAYDHTNYALFRVLIPYLDGYSGSGDRDAKTRTAFLDYLNRNVFAPLNIGQVYAKPTGPNPSLAYPNPARQTRGVNFGDWSARTGSRGLHLSVLELAAIGHALRHTRTLLTPLQADEMFVHKLGWSPDNFPLELGTLAFGGGEIRVPAPGGLAAQDTYLCSFSSGLEIAVTTHSFTDDGMGLFLKAIRAHAAGWS
jgi:CubicO group peptidase (beta-lactamase class C family)